MCRPPGTEVYKAKYSESGPSEKIGKNDSAFRTMIVQKRNMPKVTLSAFNVLAELVTAFL